MSYLCHMLYKANEKTNGKYLFKIVWYNLGLGNSIDSSTIMIAV